MGKGCHLKGQNISVIIRRMSVQAFAEYLMSLFNRRFTWKSPFAPIASMRISKPSKFAAHNLPRFLHDAKPAFVTIAER